MRQVGDLLTGDSPWLRRASHVLKWLAVLVACYLGGVAATNLAPTVAETSQYRAVLRLDPVPRHSPVLHAPTIVGDVDVQFASPIVAPGLDVQVAVREEITNLFTRPNVDIKALQPSPDEISSAIAQAAVGVGIRFVLGATAIAVLLALASHYIRQRTTRRHHVLFVASAMVVASAATFGGIAMTYQPSRFAEYRTSGVLGVVQRNAGLLADVDAVIDSGDLLNFGRVQEGDAAGLYRSIQSLGVPYIFTSGNHDQSSAGDRAVVSRLARIPNVVLLEDAAGSLRELTFHGLRITGFNDPRWFGDDNADPTAKEKPAAVRYNAAMADQPEADLVVTHEPYAVEQVDRGRLLVNGHMHTPAIEGNRIQVGTFTGGGVVSHYSEGPGQELDGQPYSFDIAQFGTSCELTSLTRYSFRNLLEGRPAYDSVQVISGARIDPYRPAAPTVQQPCQDQPDPAKRICSRIDETSLRPLPLAPGATPSVSP